MIPLGEIERRSHEITRDQPLVIMCRSGKRGGRTVAKLQAQGFSNVRNLEGGILAWKEAGQPVGSSAQKVFPLMQQVQIIIGLGVLTGVILSRRCIRTGFFSAPSSARGWSLQAARAGVGWRF